MNARRDRIAAVIREAMYDSKHDDLPPTPGEIADRLMPWMQPAGNVREWTRMARQVEQVRAIVNAHFGTGELWSSQAIERVREVLDADAEPDTWPICPTCAGEGDGPCDPTLLHGVPQPVKPCGCGHRLANHAPPDRHCLRRDCDCRAYEVTA